MAQFNVFNFSTLGFQLFNSSVSCCKLAFGHPRLCNFSTRVQCNAALSLPQGADFLLSGVRHTGRAALTHSGTVRVSSVPSERKPSIVPRRRAQHNRFIQVENGESLLASQKSRQLDPRIPPPAEPAWRPLEDFKCWFRLRDLAIDPFRTPVSMKDALWCSRFLGLRSQACTLECVWCRAFGSTHCESNAISR